MWLSWSSGKDSAFTLYQLLQEKKYQITGLFTTVTKSYDRVSMHGTRRDILHWQAKAVGLPLYEVVIPSPCTNDIYQQKMAELVHKAKSLGVTQMAFGDLFLEDVRAYRETQLAGTGIAPVFPLWGRNTTELSQEMIAAGFQARVSCVDPKQIPAHCVGRQYDSDFLAELPGTADPCGENGEFHTVVYGGPIFNQNSELMLGNIVKREGFVFADLKLVKND